MNENIKKNMINNSLKAQIALSLERSIKANAEINYSQIQNHRIISPQSVSVTGMHMAFYEVILKAKEFCISKHYILIFRDNCLMLYKYSSDFKIKLHKKIEVSYLLYKRTFFRKRQRLVLYRIYMELIENNVYRHEAWFEAITLYLDLDNAEDLCICKNGIAVAYKDGTTKYFDEYLNVVEDAADAQSLSAEGLLENTDQHYLVTKDSIELHRTGSPYVSKRKIGNIKQHMAIDDLLFILTDDRLVIIKFT